MSIIPAKYYYGEDTSEQWKRKKQTKEEARAAKKAKLDPDNYKSAKDVLDEQAASQRKRKRDEEGNVSDVEREDIEKPLDSAKKRRKQTRKQKREEKGDVSVMRTTEEKKLGIKDSTEDEENKREAKVKGRIEKKRRNKEKLEKIASKAEAKKENKVQEAALVEDSKIGSGTTTKEGVVGADQDIVEIGSIDLAVNMEATKESPSSTASASASPANRSPAFDTSTNHSGSSSISSIPPSTNSDLQHQPIKAQNVQSSAAPVPKPDPAELKNRLQSRIEALRAARKADGPNGTPARTRQELLEARRQKEEARKAHKKELRQKAKEEEARKKAETLARGSPLLTPGSPRTSSSGTGNNFSFGRVDFGGGQRASASLDAIREPKGKPKGPSDPGTALVAAQNKQSRLAGLDEEKRAEIAEKDRWLNAKKRAHGERIRDDTSLLQKTLKRKEKQKKKSEKEWENRIEGVRKGQDLRQKKREANLQKRREETGKKKKKQKGGGKPQARPGFEGSFRAKAPNGEGARRR
ncbi:MAG: hypothetical protein Q9163_003051 [Psora crenata]